MGLMVISKRELANEYATTIFSNLRSTRAKTSRLSGADGHARGTQAGKNMEINRGVGGGRPKGYLD
jgi:hypothetical protein